MMSQGGPPDDGEGGGGGYRRPPRKTRFTKGQSGYPAGRPRGVIGKHPMRLCWAGW